MSTHRANLHTTLLDGQDVQREASLVRLLLAVASAANAATTIEAATQVCVDEVCAHTGWPIGHLFLLSSDDQLLSTSIWHLDRPETFDVFCRETEALHLERGIGLPGQVLASGKPLWITDVSSDAYFARRREAQQTGIHSAFAFPVLVGNEVVAVLEFFSQDEDEPDEPLLEIMANIGTQLGRVVERERATRALREREQEKYALLQSTDRGIYGIDERGLCTFVNRSGAQMLGYDPEELLGKNIHRVIHHSHADGSPYPVEECPIYRASTTGEGCHIDHEVLWKKDGTSFSAEYSSHPIMKGDKVSGAVVSFTDITERKQIEEALQESERQYRQVIERASDGILTYDQQGAITDVNPIVCEMLGYSRHELLALNVTDIIDPEDLRHLTCSAGKRKHCT